VANSIVSIHALRMIDVTALLPQSSGKISFEHDSFICVYFYGCYVSIRKYRDSGPRFF